MKFILIVTFGFFLSHQLFSQVTVQGSVKSPKGSPLTGVSVTLKDTYDGSTTDSLGQFHFATTEKGNHTLTANLTGYKESEQAIAIASESITVHFILKEEITALNAVVITAGSFEANDKKRATLLKSLDIATTAGANADISSTIQTLPGAQKIGESEGLFIRGGSAEESKIIIDGSVVNNFFFSSVPGISQRGRFSPFLFNNTVFSSGGYSALYGQALSAVLNLESLDIPDRSEVQAGISPLFASVGFQHVAAEKNSSWGANYGYTNLALYNTVIKQGPEMFKSPESHTLETNYRHRGVNGGLFKIYAYGNTSKLGMRRNSLDSLGLKNEFTLNNDNVFVQTSYKHFLGNGWKWYTAGSVSLNKDAIATTLKNSANQSVPETNDFYLNKATLTINQSQQMFQVRSVMDKSLNNLNSIRFGAELWNNRDSVDIQNSFGLFGNRISDRYVATFMEADIYLSKNIAFRPGFRVENSSLLKRSNLAPRASLSIKTGTETQLSFDYGKFYQTPERRYLAKTSNIGFTRADHYIATYQWISTAYILRGQIFNKEYVNLLKTDAVTNLATGNNGKGYARGVELFWRDRKTLKGLDYWISYSYLDTKRAYLTYPIMAQPAFAAKHTGSVVIKKFWVKHMFGINWSYNWATGRPYYNPNKPASEFLSDRTQAFHSNNFSFNWLTKVAKANAVVVVGINNVFNQKPIFGYNYSQRIKDTNGDYVHEPVSLPAPRIIFVGMFLSWGVDRSQQNINSNL